MTTSTPAPIVAIMSPGDMGHAVGALLKRNGARVITSLEGRSQRTKELAVAAGIEAMADDADMVDAADILLSIVAPAEAEKLALRLTPVIEAAKSGLVYVDCNAVSPETVLRIAELVESSGARFVDAGIVGPPPQQESHATRFYASGGFADHLALLKAYGLDVRVIGKRIGEASALKMCYAALNKGTIALMTGVSVMAERLGVGTAFDEEIALSQEAARRRMRQQVPGMVPKAHRWIGEMEEIAETFASADLTPAIFDGIADIYRLVADSGIAATTPEAWRRKGKSYEEVVSALASQERKQG